MTKSMRVYRGFVWLMVDGPDAEDAMPEILQMPGGKIFTCAPEEITASIDCDDARKLVASGWE